MIHSISTANMSREDWLAERRNSIGGSEMGAILGINKYTSPYTVWATKTGLISEPEDNEAMRQGRDLEEYVAQRFSERSGYKVRRENAIIRNDDFPHIHANIDRKIVGLDAGLECKTASALATKAYKDGEFPESYYAQCVTYMAVREFPRYYLAALILGKDFKIYQLTRFPDDECPEWCESSVYVSDGEIEALRQIAIEFWENVETCTPPPVDGKEPTTEALQTIYKDSQPGDIELVGRTKALDTYKNIDAQIKELKAQQELLKQVIMEDLGENEIGHCDGYTVTWKPQTRKTFDVEEFKRVNPEIDLSPYYKTNTFRRFCVKGEN